MQNCRVAASPYPAYTSHVGPVSEAPPGNVYSIDTTRFNRRIRGTIDALSSHSAGLWNPAPIGPNPSSVGMPSAAVWLASLPPPTAC